MEEVHALVASAAASETDTTTRHQAFGKLVGRFQDMAYGCAYARLGDFHMAEDAAQEAFVTAYQDLNKLENPQAFPGWFRTIVVRQCSRLEQKGRIQTQPVDAAADIPSSEPDPAELVERREQQRTVQAAIRTLPEEQRMVTSLFYISGYSQKEIAEFLDVPAATVRKRLQYARTKLKERMLTMVSDMFEVQKPSKDEKFREHVMAMLTAANMGDTKKVGELLDDNPDLIEARGDAQGVKGVTPVWAAAAGGHKETVDKLLDKGADIDAKDEEVGYTSLHVALGAVGLDVAGSDNLAEHLIQRGATVDIFAALTLQDMDKVRAFIEEDPGIVHKKGPEGARPLHFASNAESTRLILEAGADPHALDDWHRSTALGWKFRGGEARDLILEAMTAKGDDIFLACARGDVGQVRAFLSDNPSLIEAQDDRHFSPEDGFMPIHFAALFGRLDVVRSLIEQGADVNAMSKEHDHNLCQTARHPLHLASDAGHMNVVSYLLDQGLDVNFAYQGRTALHFATASDNMDLVRMLVEKGADASARDDEHDSTPYGWAEHFQRPEIAAYLADQTDDILVAAWVGSHEAVRRMLDQGVDIQTRSGQGATPLHRAIWMKHPEVVKLLLERGADIHAKDDYGQTPLIIATAPYDTVLEGWGKMPEPNQEIIDLMKQHGADV